MQMILTQFMREFLAKDSNTNTNTCENVVVEASTYRQAINEVVEAISKDNHPCHCSNGPFTFGHNHLMIMSMFRLWPLSIYDYK